MERVFIGFGSNQGKPVKTCLQVLERFRAEGSPIEVVRASSLYRTKPLGPVDQEWFINGVMECRTRLGPEALFEFTQGVEHDFGRIRTVQWGPRTLDLDILGYGDRVVNAPSLHIPHPRLHERLFVLVPMAEIAPGWMHPVLKETVREMLTRLLSSDHDQEVQLVNLGGS